MSFLCPNPSVFPSFFAFCALAVKKVVCIEAFIDVYALALMAAVHYGNHRLTVKAPLVYDVTIHMTNRVIQTGGAGAAAGSPILRVSRVSASYLSRAHGLFGKKTVKPVLDSVSLEIREGEIFGLVGPSGCGKTTLGRCILGLINYAGEILIDGAGRAGRRGPDRRERALKVQAVFQDPAASLNPVKRIGWIMEEPLAIHGIGSRPQRVRQVDDMLELVGLDPSYKTRRVNELSSGQKQRVCIGRALMLKPKLIIADEAVSAMDVSVGAQILNLFRELHETLGMALLFISHNIDAVYYLCDRIAVMERGRIVKTGTAEEISADYGLSS
jgi:ABC-type glutathione transport system ATPase component